MDEGVIKYSSERVDGLVPVSAALSQLNAARTTLFELGLIGAYPDGIGYGNLSLRQAENPPQDAYRQARNPASLDTTQ